MIKRAFFNIKCIIVARLLRSMISALQALQFFSFGIWRT